MILEKELKMESALRYLKQQGNSTFLTSVKIRVTPIENDYTSWTILWISFLMVSLLASYQVVTDYCKNSNNSSSSEVDDSNHHRYNNLSNNRSSNNSSHHHHHHTSTHPTHNSNSNNQHRRPSNSFRSHDADGAGTTAAAASESNGISTADTTRSLFRRLLLFAMVARLIAIPIQIYTHSLWIELICDTLPGMIFASAWMLLVSFFIQLVGVASGGPAGTTNSPASTTSIAIQIIAYIVYAAIIGAYFFDNLASVLLYAFLCCIYAALFGTVLYFGPKLLILLRPNLQKHVGLALRLGMCSTLCILLFGTRMVFFALNIVSPPTIVYWWFNYGVLELFPSFVFLIAMHPSSTNNTEQQQQSNNSLRRNNSSTTSRGYIGGNGSGIMKGGNGPFIPFSAGGNSPAQANLGGNGSRKSSKTNLKRVNSTGSGSAAGVNNGGNTGVNNNGRGRPIGVGIVTAGETTSLLKSNSGVAKTTGYGAELP